MIAHAAQMLKISKNQRTGRFIILGNYRGSLLLPCLWHVSEMSSLVKTIL